MNLYTYNFNYFIFGLILICSSLVKAQSITGFSPKYGPIGTNINISGSGFSDVPSENHVTIGGLKAIVKASTNKSLIVVVPSGASYSNINIEINGNIVSSNTSFNITNGCLNSSLEVKADYVENISPFNPNFITTGDYNNDNQPDLVSSSSNIGGIMLYTGLGNGKFKSNYIYTGFDNSSIAVGDFNADGNLDLATANFNSNNIAVLIGVGNGTFAERVTYGAGTNPQSLTTRDFNNDGKLDLAIANSISNTVSILLGTGSGSFSVKTDFVTGTKPQYIGTGDFNGDNYSDLAIVNSGSNTISILTGLGNGTFSQKVDYTTGTNPQSVSLGDLNNDNKQDLAISNYGSNTVSVLMGVGDGTFVAKPDLITGTNPQHVAIGDFNGDNNTDIAVTNKTSNSLSVFTGLGSGAFLTKTDYQTGTSPISIAVSDVNGDSKQDLALVSSNIISIVLNNCSRIISQPNPISYYNVCGTLPSISVTTDGIITPSFQWFSNSSPSNIGGSIIDGATSSNYTPENPLGAKYYYCQVYDSLGSDYSNVSLVNGTIINDLSPVSGAVGSNVTIKGCGFSSNPSDNIVRFGNIKAVVTNSNTTTLTVTVPAGASYDKISVQIDDRVNTSNLSFNTVDGCTNSFFSANTNYTTNAAGYAIATGDFNNDGLQDMAIANSGVSIFIGNSNGTFAAKVDYAKGGWLTGIAVGDFNSDGNQDLVITNATTNLISVLMGSGTGTFATKIDYSTGTQPVGLAVGDFNNDGKQDIAVTNVFRANVSVFINLGNGTFASKVDYDTGGSPVSLSIGDYNKDGKQDIATANSSSNNISVLLGTGTGKFNAKTDFATGTTPNSITMGDFNSDNIPDLAVANKNSNTVSVLLGMGTGSFLTKVDYTTSTSPSSVKTGDFNGDGKLDILLPNTILAGIGNGTFAPKSDFSTGSAQSSYLTVTDFNGDGKHDIAMISTNKYVSVWLSQCSRVKVQPLISQYSCSENFTTISVTANTLVPPSYQWYSNTFEGYNGALIIDSATSSSYFPPLPNGTNYYFCKITDSWGSDNSNLSLVSNEIVTIDSFKPTSGAPGTSVTITGCGFSLIPENNTVTFGGLKAMITNVSSSTLTVTVPQGASFNNIVVKVGNSIAKSPIAFNSTYSCVNSSFPAIKNNSYSTSMYVAMISGDFNKDGIQDIAAINNNNSILSIIMGIGNGKFSPKVDYSTGKYPNSITIGDFNSDGNEDLVVTNSSSYNISVFLGTNTGTFLPKTDYETIDSPGYVTVGDFNYDGKQDLAIIIPSLSNISILIGNGKGGFSTYGKYASDLGAIKLTIADFNGDKKQDIAVVNYGGKTISVFLNIGEGKFAAKLDYNLQNAADNILSSDFNNDGIQDLAVGSSASKGIFILTGIGNGTFKTKYDFYLTGKEPLEMALADLNGDNIKDLVINVAPDYFSILIGKNNGKFNATINYAVEANKRGLLIGDYNNDGKQDIGYTRYTTSDEFYALLSTCSRILMQPSDSNYTLCSGGTFLPLIVNAQSNNTLSYQWYSNTVASNTNGKLIVGQIHQSFLPQTTEKGTLYYYCKVSDSSGTEISNLSGAYTTISKPDSTFTISGLNIIANESNATYQWLDCKNSHSIVNGATNQIFTNTPNSAFAVIISNNYCSDTSSCSDFFLTDIAKDNPENGFYIYPNPNSGTFTIVSDQDTDISITNILGKELLNKHITKGSQSVNLPDPASGIYFLKISSNNYQKTIQLNIY